MSVTVHRIDKEKFTHAQWEILGRVLEAQKGNKVAFANGWFKDQEGYKCNVWKTAQDILQYDTWRKEYIHTYDLTGRIAQCMDIPMRPGKKHNLLDWRDTDNNGEKSLKKMITVNKARSEELIYQIFRGEDEGQAFTGAIKEWGARYTFISFLFFLKNINKFVPVRPKIMARRFKQLGIEFDLKCSWENYQEYLQIIQEVQEKLKENVDQNTKLIDAHSFVWAAWILDKPEYRPSQLAVDGENIEKEVERKEIFGYERKVLAKARVNQSSFRKHLLQRYNKCSLCGVSNHELLIASHIRPWSDSNRSEKTDVDNGLLLCPNHDWLFDGGWITFADDGKIMISEKLSQNDRVFTHVKDGLHIDLTEGNKEYMAYHRENIFRDRAPIN